MTASTLAQLSRTPYSTSRPPDRPAHRRRAYRAAAAKPDGKDVLAPSEPEIMRRSSTMPARSRPARRDGGRASRWRTRRNTISAARHGCRRSRRRSAWSRSATRRMSSCVCLRRQLLHRDAEHVGRLPQQSRLAPQFRSGVAAGSSTNAAIENAAQPVSRYDVIAVNFPWVGEFASKGLIRPIGDRAEAYRRQSARLPPRDLVGRACGTASNTACRSTAPSTCWRRARICSARRISPIRATSTTSSPPGGRCTGRRRDATASCGTAPAACRRRTASCSSWGPAAARSCRCARCARRSRWRAPSRRT